MEKKETAVQKVAEENITDRVLTKVTALTSTGALKLPGDYSPQNALKSAFLILQETVDKEKKPVLSVCTKESVALALFDMVVRALNPSKKQCYFISYGTKLLAQPSYFGNMATAKRVGMKDIIANIIYEGDVPNFIYSIDPKTGRKSLVKHETKLENIDINKISGAYAIYTMEDGTQNMEVMNIKQIQQSWLQGAAKGNSPAHKNFTDEMCKKTVINRACKTIINSSDDSYLFEESNNPDDKDGSITPHTDVSDANAEKLVFPDTPQENATPENNELKADENIARETVKGPDF